jgi:cyclic pyranopterin phosphate synthase
MPPDGVPLVSHQDILSYEEILLIVRAAAEIGMNKIRITGGEPLVRAGVVDLVRMISEVEGILEMSMTTNGILLHKYAGKLAEAGLQRINISLDTMKPERFRQITRTGDLADVLSGIKSAGEAGLNPVKINVVPLQGINDDEIQDFARLTLDKGWHVRFIELMPLQGATGLVPANLLRREIEKVGKLEPHYGLAGNGAAKYYRLPGAGGTLGFIEPLSEPFCNRCNRMRLSASGTLLPCLFSTEGIDVRTPLRAGATLQDIKRLLMEAVAAKPEMHRLSDNCAAHTRMSGIGG